MSYIIVFCFADLPKVDDTHIDTKNPTSFSGDDIHKLITQVGLPWTANFSLVFNLASLEIFNLKCVKIRNYISMLIKSPCNLRV